VQHVIFGAGLIGGYLAGAFTAKNVKTAIVGRLNIVQAIKNGITISDFSGNESSVSSIEIYDAAKPVDVLWLTVKCTAVESSIVDLKKIVQPGTLIVCCQNGFGSDQAVRRAFPNNVVLGAVVGFNVAEKSPVHLHRSTEGKLVLEDHEQIARELQSIDSELLPTKLSTNYLADQWAKLQLNLANPVNALADIPVKAMTEDPGFRSIIADLMNELLSVTDALKLDLPKLTAVPAKMIPRTLRLPNWIFTRLAQKMLAIDPSARASMWWDLTQGKRSEIDYLNGAVVKQANELGISCPQNEAIVKLVHSVERGHKKIGFSSNELKAELKSELKKSLENG